MKKKKINRFKKSNNCSQKYIKIKRKLRNNKINGIYDMVGLKTH